MIGMRCVECGEVRWSFFGRMEDRNAECPACGAQMIEERRHPGRSKTPLGERREHAEPRVQPPVAAR